MTATTEPWGTDPTVTMPVDPTDVMPAPAELLPEPEPAITPRRRPPLLAAVLAVAVLGATIGAAGTWAAMPRTGPEVVQTAGTVPDVATTAAPKASVVPAPTRGVAPTRRPTAAKTTVCR